MITLNALLTYLYIYINMFTYRNKVFSLMVMRML